MLNRRNFIKNTAGLGSLPLVPELVYGANPVLPAFAPKSIIIAASDCVDGRRFASVDPDTLIAAAHDPMDMVSALMTILPTTNSNYVIGLGSAAHYFVINREARSLGLKPTYHGKHVYSGGTVTHTLSGAKNIQPLAQLLADSGEIWAETLAKGLGQQYKPAGDAHQTSGRARRPVNGSGHLVSWAFAIDRSFV